MRHLHKHIAIGFGSIVSMGVIITFVILLGYKTQLHASVDPEIPIIFDPTETTSSPVQVYEVPVPINTNSAGNVSIIDQSPEVVLDTDGDGLADDIEHAIGTDPANFDTDNDGYKDGEEVDHGFSPLNSKPDRSVVTRSIEIDLDHQQLKYIFNGVKVRTFSVSTGLPNKPTPTGQFKIFAKVPVARYIGPDYDLPNVKWNMEFKPGYFIHGAYWHHYFGIEPASHGCINLSEDDAEKVYAFLQTGDRVMVRGKTPHGKVQN
jgi:lipoprotein-anchoring transpeptidase ErfK/SrfK